MSLLLCCCTTFYRSYLLAWFHPHLQMMMRMKITTHGEKAKTRGYLSEKIVSILLILFKVLASELNILADSQFFACCMTVWHMKKYIMFQSCRDISFELHFSCSVCQAWYISWYFNRIFTTKQWHYVFLILECVLFWNSKRCLCDGG